MPPPRYIRESIGRLRRPRTKGAATSGGAFIFTTRRPRNSSRRPSSLSCSLLPGSLSVGQVSLVFLLSLFFSVLLARFLAISLSLLFLPLSHDTYECARSSSGPSLPLSLSSLRVCKVDRAIYVGTRLARKAHVVFTADEEKLRGSK